MTAYIRIALAQAAKLARPEENLFVQHRRLEGRIVVATHNEGKLREMRELLAPYGITAVSAGELDLAEPEETGTTFAENAEIKARAAAQVSGLPAFADDSGICVEGLAGAPGIYSARWAQNKEFGAAMARIDSELQEHGFLAPDERRGYFISALAVVWPDGHLESFEGRIDGTLVWPPRGEAGFGYDPMFLPQGHERTFGEMSSQEKHGIPEDGSRALSHRARAFQLLAAACLGAMPPD
jgi:XTP/dITP diphosphohydrolase